MSLAPVNLVASRSVCVFRGRELIRMDAQSVDLDPDLVRGARDELLARECGGLPGYRWGYLLGVEEVAEAVVAPLTRQLKREVYDQVVAPVGHCRNVEFAFSFFKAAVGQPPAAREGLHYGGFHLDTHPKLTGDHGVELLRVLVNLARTPREVRFAPVDRYELARRGAGVERGDYQVVALPAEMPSERVEVSGFDGTTVSYLTFWASVVPHVGIDTSAGYFLASFEGLGRL